MRESAREASRSRPENVSLREDVRITGSPILSFLTAVGAEVVKWLLLYPTATGQLAEAPQRNR